MSIGKIIESGLRDVALVGMLLGGSGCPPLPTPIDVTARDISAAANVCSARQDSVESCKNDENSTNCEVAMRKCMSVYLDRNTETFCLILQPVPGETNDYTKPQAWACSNVTPPPVSNVDQPVLIAASSDYDSNGTPEPVETTTPPNYIFWDEDSQLLFTPSANDNSYRYAPPVIQSSGGTTEPFGIISPSVDMYLKDEENEAEAPTGEIATAQTVIDIPE